MNLQKIGVKLYAEGAEGLNLLDLIPVFHGWIQNGALADTAIDVADYTHVHHGPGVMLIAHEGNYALDEADGRRGLLYHLKHPVGESSAAALRQALLRAAEAARLLEQSPGLVGRVSFPLLEFDVFANDRLAAPGTPVAASELSALVAELAAELFGPEAFQVSALDTDPRDRTTVRLRAAAPTPVSHLLPRLAA